MDLITVTGICKPLGGAKSADTLKSGFQPGELLPSRPRPVGSAMPSPGTVASLSDAKGKEEGPPRC